MRPGEVIRLRGADLDMSGPMWEYRPPIHKTQHHVRVGWCSSVRGLNHYFAHGFARIRMNSYSALASIGNSKPSQVARLDPHRMGKTAPETPHPSRPLLTGLVSPGDLGLASGLGSSPGRQIG